MVRRALFVAFLLCAAERARAANCCGSVLALGDRLGPGEVSALQFGLTGRDAFGWFGSSRSFRGNDPGSVDMDGRFGVSFDRRFTEEWQASLGAGWLEGLRQELDTPRSVGGFLTDVTVGGRFEPSALPRWAFTGQLSIPTGRTIGASQTPLLADVTGRGMFGLRLAAAFEQPIEAWFVLAQAGVEGLGPNRDGGSRGGVAGDLLVMAGYTFTNAAALSAGVRTLLTTYAMDTGSSGALSQTTSAVVSGGYPFASRWTASASVGVDLPVPGLSAETQTRVSVTLGLRALLERQ